MPNEEKMTLEERRKILRKQQKRDMQPTGKNVGNWWMRWEL